MAGDERRNVESIAEEGDGKGAENEPLQQPTIVLKRIPKRKKEMDPDSRRGPDEAVEQSFEVQRSEHFPEPDLEHRDTAPSELEPSGLETAEEDAPKDGKMAENISDESDSSLEREFLHRPKKMPKKRKYVLTLQKYKGKKRRKPKVEVPEENNAQTAEVEEAMPRLESRVKMLSEVSSPRVGPKAKKRRELIQRAQSINSVLKESVPDTSTGKERHRREAEHEKKEKQVENGQEQEQVPEPFQEQGQGQEQQQDQEQPGSAAETPDSQEHSSPPHSVNKSKEVMVLMEISPAMKDVASILESKPSPFDRGIKLRGRKLKKRINGKFYRGEVADYDRRNRKYKIRFDDGDEETVMWKDLEPMLATFEEMSRWDTPEPERDDDEVDGEDKKKRKKKKKREAKLPRLTPQPRKRPKRN